MRVLHIVSSIARSSGGPSRSSQGLVAGLRRHGLDVWLVTLHKGESPWIKGVDQFINGGEFDSILDVLKPDVVHIHGIWLLSLHRCAKICQKRGIPYVIAPRGMLEPWSLKTKWLKKRIARLIYQDRDLKSAAALHATADSEEAQFRKLGLQTPVIVSPNGVNLPDRQIKTDTRRLDRPLRALFVSRMHPKKGVLELVESWGRVNPKGWECELVYTINGEFEEAYEEQVKSRVRSLCLGDKFIFTGPLDDEKKWDAYARADLFVLPTYSENFGIVVAEALWAGLPVITTRGAPWSDLVSLDCGWWIDLPPHEGLDVALREAISLPKHELRKMGARGHQLIIKKYTWESACESVIRGYQSIVFSKHK